MAFDKEQAVRALFAAFLSGDRESADKLLSDDFTFTSPYDDAINKETYYERCWPNRFHIKEHHIEQTAAVTEGVFVLYRLTTDAGKRSRNTEFFTFNGDRIRSVEVFFGAEIK